MEEITLYKLDHKLKNNFYVINLNSKKSKIEGKKFDKKKLINQVGRLELTSSKNYLLTFEHPFDKSHIITGYIDQNEIKIENIKPYRTDIDTVKN